MKKLIVVATTSIVLLLAGYLLYRYFFYTCCAIPPKRTLVSSNGSGDNPVLNDPNLLFAERTIIGFCRTRSGDGGSCYSSTFLYSSGRLVLESGETTMAPDGEKITAFPAVEKQLDKTLMARIIKQIRDSRVLTKPCEAELILDVYANYFINLDGVKREIKFPGCESELKAIYELINPAE